MLSYAEHGRLPAQTQGRGPAARKRIEPWAFQLEFRQCPASSSGPRALRERNGSLVACFARVGAVERHVSVAGGASLSKPAGHLDTLNPAVWSLNGFCNVNFASDNTAPVAPAILDAIAQANNGYARGYGNDDWTQTVERRLAEIFEHDVAVFLVSHRHGVERAGAGAVLPALGRRVLSRRIYIATDECGAPEFFGGGLKLAGLQGDAGKIAPDTLQTALAGYGDLAPHQMILVGALHHTGDRSRHDLSARRDCGPCRDRASALACRAHGWRAFRQRVGPPQRDAGAIDLAVRRRRALVRRHQGRRARRGSGRGIRSGARIVHGGTAQTRRSSSIEAPLSRRAIRSLPRRRPVAEAGAPRQRHGRSVGGKTASDRPSSRLAG